MKSSEEPKHPLDEPALLHGTPMYEPDDVEFTKTMSITWGIGIVFIITLIILSKVI